MIVRPATTQEDIACMLKETVALRQQSWFQHIPYAFTVEDLAKWYVSKSLTDTAFCLYVVETKGKVVGGCGGVLSTQTLPPHLLFVSEWTWWGTKKAAALAWREVEAWGKARGAVLSCRTTQSPKQEVLTWRAL